MSVHVTSPVWRMRLRAPEKLVLLKLADCADDDGANAFPRVRRVAEECGLSVRTVQAILRGLEASGRIAIQRPADGAAHKPTTYRICLPPPQDVHRGGAGRAPGGVQDVHRPGADDAPPTRDPSLTRPLDPSFNGAPATLITLYHVLFTARFGQPPVINGGKDGALLKRLTRQYGKEKVEALLRAFFESEDRWIVGSGYTVGAFHASVNKLIAQERAPDRFAGLREFVGETG